MGPASLHMHFARGIDYWSSCRWEPGVGRGGTNGQEGGKREYAGGKHEVMRKRRVSLG